MTTNWEEKTIGRLCKFTSGHGFTPSEWSDKGLPIIRIQNLNGATEFNYYEGEPEQEWIVRPGDLLFAWAGTKGVSFGATIWKGQKGVLNQHIYRVHPTNGIDKIWLYYALQVATSRIEAKAHGFKSTLLHVHKADITKQIVIVPSLLEQKRIAQFLSTWGNAIEQTENLIATKTKLKRGLMQQLLTRKKRFKEFEGNKWNAAKFGDFLKESRIEGSNGAVAKKITVKLYGKGVIEKQDRLQGSTNTKYYVRKSGQFIYSKLDFLNGAFGIVPKHLDGFESTLDLPAFYIVNGLHPDWLLYTVIQERFYSNYKNAAEGGRKARRVQPSEFLTTKFLFPSIEEQRRIADVLNACDKEIELLQQQLDALKKQKRGLMQKLLTGQIRVKIDEQSKLEGVAV